jgi:hypothetical protein
MSMTEGYKSAASLTRSRMAIEQPQDLENLAKTQVVVVGGCYDHGEQIFDLCEIPRSLIAPESVAGINLDPDQILFVNCPGNVPPRGLAKIESFVRQGGLLVTTDWALKNVIQAVFPGTIEFNQRATGDDVVRVVFEQVEDTFLEGLIDPKADPLWWLEGSSYPIRILDRERVQVLVSSREMEERYGEAPIVVAFEHGAGKVYHLTSHFFLQRTETRTNRQAQPGSAYATEKGLSLSQVEARDGTSWAGCTLGEAQAAYTSARSLTNLVVEQSRRVQSRSS